MWCLWFGCPCQAISLTQCDEEECGADGSGAPVQAQTAAAALEPEGLHQQPSRLFLLGHPRGLQINFCSCLTVSLTHYSGGADVFGLVENDIFDHEVS